MARRARSFRRRRRQHTIWTDIRLLQASLPTVLLDENTPIDGAFSGVTRLEGTDFTQKRTIVDMSATISQLADPASNSTMLEICIGLGWFDSMQDAGGQAVNTTIVAGAGPLDDINNSKWFARCCVYIPLGSMILRVPTAPNDNGTVIPVPGGSLFVIGPTAATREIVWQCHLDTKAQRKQEGQQSEYLNVAIQARVASGDLAAGDDVSIQMHGFMGRQVLAINT